MRKVLQMKARIIPSDWRSLSFNLPTAARASPWHKSVRSPGRTWTSQWGGGDALVCARKSGAIKRRICLEGRDCLKIIRGLIYSSIPGNHECAQNTKTMLLCDFVCVLRKITSFVERQLRKMTGCLGCFIFFFSVPKVKLRINHQNTVPTNSALDGSVGKLSGRF